MAIGAGLGILQGFIEGGRCWAYFGIFGFCYAGLILNKILTKIGYIYTYNECSLKKIKQINQKQNQ